MSIRTSSDLGKRQKLRFAVGDEDRVFVVCGKRTVLGLDGPAVRHDPDCRATRVHHGFDCDCHAAQQSRTVARRAEVRHLGALVHLSADAVTDIFAHDAVAIVLNVFLHRRRDIRKALALAGESDAFEEALLCDVDEPLGLGGNFSAGVSGCALFGG